MDTCNGEGVCRSTLSIPVEPHLLHKNDVHLVFCVTNHRFFNYQHPARFRLLRQQSSSQFWLPRLAKTLLQMYYNKSTILLTSSLSSATGKWRTHFSLSLSWEMSIHYHVIVNIVNDRLNKGFTELFKKFRLSFHSWNILELYYADTVSAFFPFYLIFLSDFSISSFK